MRLPCPFSLLAGLFLAVPALAHEFWIDPHRFQVETGGPIVADLRNGERFRGIALGYFQHNTERHELVGPDGTLPVEGRMGDVPALQTVAGRDGLWIIVHQTTPSTLTYSDWDKFKAFADHKDFPDIAARHRARGLPDTGFRERYTRFAKALVAVGDGAGGDRAVGMETEFVALTNPYTAGASDMRIRLLYQGRPRADAQVEMFARAPDGSVTVTLHRTDTKGEVALPVSPGHAYLLDAVVLREPESGNGPAWESLWASLTFAVP